MNDQEKFEIQIRQELCCVLRDYLDFNQEDVQQFLEKLDKCAKWVLTGEK